MLVWMFCWVGVGNVRMMLAWTGKGRYDVGTWWDRGWHYVRTMSGRRRHMDGKGVVITLVLRQGDVGTWWKRGCHYVCPTSAHGGIGVGIMLGQRRGDVGTWWKRGWHDVGHTSGGDEDELNCLWTRKNGFGRIWNEVELVFFKGFRLTTDWLGLPGNGKSTGSDLDINWLWTGYGRNGSIEDW